MAEIETGGGAGGGRIKTDAADRVIAFLQNCGDVDIESGVGALLGTGTPERIADFRNGLAGAIESALGTIIIEYHGSGGD